MSSSARQPNSKGDASSRREHRKDKLKAGMDKAQKTIQKMEMKFIEQQEKENEMVTDEVDAAQKKKELDEINENAHLNNVLSSYGVANIALHSEGNSGDKSSEAAEMSGTPNDGLSETTGAGVDLSKSVVIGGAPSDESSGTTGAGVNLSKSVVIGGAPNDESSGTSEDGYKLADPDIPEPTTENHEGDDDVVLTDIQKTLKEDSEDKWSPYIPRGSGDSDLRLEGKIKRWNHTKLVMAVGPKNSTSYRLYKAHDMEEFDDPDARNLIEGRYGEMKGDDKKFKYGKSHAKSIQGVAWYADEQILMDFPEYFPTAVDLVKPKRKPADFPIVKRTTAGDNIRMQVVDCVIKIKWFIDEEYVTSWETRQTVRRIWGLIRGDNAIYEAAKNQEEFFEDWNAGNRLGKDQSATPFRGLTPLRAPRAQTLALEEDQSLRERTQSPALKAQFETSFQGLAPSRASRAQTPAFEKQVHFHENENDMEEFIQWKAYQARQQRKMGR